MFYTNWQGLSIKTVDTVSNEKIQLNYRVSEL
jgi:hypothetical protein